METISQVLFWVANSLLIPDILLLLLLFIRALLLVGGIYNQYMAKRKNDKRLNDLIKNLTPDKVDDLRKALPAKDNSLYIRYLRDLLTNPASQDYADYLISNFENDAEKDVSHPVPKAGANVSEIALETGSFAFLEPRDAHRPSVKLHSDASKKLIFKIPV